MFKSFIASAISALMLTTLVVAQTPGTGNVGATELSLQTATGSNALDGLDKAAPIGSVLTMSVSSDGTLDGAPFLLAGGLASVGTDPVHDFGSEVGIVGLPLPSIFTIIDGISPTTSGALFPGVVTVAPGGSVIGALLPCLPASESLYLQSAAVDASKPNGYTLTTAIEHNFSDAVTAGPTSDDGNVFHAFSCMSGFDFYGTNYTGVYVNANGNLTFGSADSDFNATAGEMLSDQPRIAPSWHDVSPNAGGSVTITEGLGGVTVAWVDVPGYNVPDLNNFSATLYNSGDIDLSATQLSGNGTNIVGIAPGAYAASYTEADLRFGGVVVGGAGEPIFEEFDGSDCANDARAAEGLVASFTNNGGSYTMGATYIAVEAVTSLSPAVGFDTGGEQVTITGTFQIGGIYEVTFGSNPPVAGNVIDSCTLEATTPPNASAPEVVDVTVTNTGTTASYTLPASYTYNPAGVNTGSFSLSDDGNGLLSFSVAPASVTFYGVSYTELYVNANGNITFGSSDNDFSESESEMIGDQPRIALFWDDCNPSNGGTISYVEDATTVSVTYANITAYSTGDNTGTVTINKLTGEITLSYGADCTSFSGTTASRTVLSGISSGGGLGVATAVDLGTAGMTTAAGADDALYEYFNGSGPAWDINGQSFGFTPTGGVGVGPYMHHNP